MLIMHTILIVEDEEMLRMAYVDIFTAEKFIVSQAANGQVALDLIRKNPPAVIVLDVLMPVMGGMEFLKHANIKKNYPDTKVLVLSNLSDKETVQDVVNLGATKHCIKSNLSPRQLVAAVKELLT